MSVHERGSTVSTKRWVSVGQSTDTDSYAAGVEAATLAVAGRSAALLLVFCSDSHDLEQLLAGINETSGNAPLIGCSTAGEIATAGPTDLSVVITALAKRAEALMRHGGSLLTLTYYGAEKVMPHYNVMGVAKAALEASVRYLAADLGKGAIRVNAISAGPVRTLAARSIAGFTEMETMFVERAPLRRHIDADDVAAASAYLLSDDAKNVTGTTLYVDAGYHAMGM